MGYKYKRIDELTPSQWRALERGAQKLRDDLIKQSKEKHMNEETKFGAHFDEVEEGWEELEDNFEVTEKGEYKQKIQFYTESNKPILAIFFNWFNWLNHQRVYENTPTINDVTIKGILDNDNSFMDTLPEYPPVTFTYTVILEYKGILLSVVLTAFKENGQVRNIIRMTSVNVEIIKPLEIYDSLFKLAIDNSNLKGAYMTIEDEALLWKIRELKNITFDDVYLPEILTEDVTLYTKLFEKKGILQRYMFSGIPGTAKTESTRAISNILNKQGVTVIKTNICKIIKQKFELAKILAPSIIILDDIDLYLGDRNSTGVSPLLGAFLDILDGVDKLPDDVGVIASTNAPHLIDLAAQRPGRFNKVLFFDELTYDNVKNIILKSLKYMDEKHNNISKKDVELLTDTKLVSFFKEKNVTGAFIFEAVQEIKNKSETLDRPIDIDKTIAEITQKNDTLDKKLKTVTIENKLRKTGGRLGF
jgi:AAA+ superfamily predicted ATPase